MPINECMYGGSREDLWPELPYRGRLLDIGAGQGHLGRDLAQARPELRVVAIEADERAATIARQWITEVHVLDVEREPIPEPDHSFDCILLADVLEHMADPWAALRGAHRLLAPEGYLVASIPNVGHYSALLALLRQDWPQRDGGLFDRTHLRFFTRRTMMSLFLDCGYEILRVRPKHALNRKWQLIDRFSHGRLTSFGVVGFVLTARPSKAWTARH